MCGIRTPKPLCCVQQPFTTELNPSSRCDKGLLLMYGVCQSPGCELRLMRLCLLRACIVLAGPMQTAQASSRVPPEELDRGSRRVQRCLQLMAMAVEAGQVRVHANKCSRVPKVCVTFLCHGTNLPTLHHTALLFACRQRVWPF